MNGLLLIVLFITSKMFSHVALRFHGKYKIVSVSTHFAVSDGFMNKYDGDQNKYSTFDMA